MEISTAVLCSAAHDGVLIENQIHYFELGSYVPISSCRAHTMFVPIDKILSHT